MIYIFAIFLFCVILYFIFRKNPESNLIIQTITNGRVFLNGKELIPSKINSDTYSYTFPKIRNTDKLQIVCDHIPNENNVLEGLSAIRGVFDGKRLPTFGLEIVKNSITESFTPMNVDWLGYSNIFWGDPVRGLDITYIGSQLLK